MLPDFHLPYAPKTSVRARKSPSQTLIIRSAPERAITVITDLAREKNTTITVKNLGVSHDLLIYRGDTLRIDDSLRSGWVIKGVKVRLGDRKELFTIRHRKSCNWRD